MLRKILAILLLHNNQQIAIHELIDELWSNDPPASALPTVQTYIYRIRHTVLHTFNTGDDLLRTKPLGYQLAVSNDLLDSWRFDGLMADGQAALRGGDPSTATQALGQALSLWRGHPLAGIQPGELLSAQIARLEECWLRARELRIEADLQLGRHHELVSELKTLCATHPLHEGLYAKLMIALSRSGRRYEALALYHTFRHNLIDELGLEPTPVLANLQQAVLAADPQLQRSPETGPLVIAAEPAATNGSAPAMVPDSVPLPAQLPPNVIGFSGRRGLLGRLSMCFAQEQSARQRRVLWITGMVGTGKSAFAVELAHRLRAYFPDGQFYARLGGSTAQPVHLGQVVRGFLAAAGFRRDTIPEDGDECCNLLRSWAAGRSVLMLLDDARSAEQVTPLLPGNGSWALIVTSRVGGMPGVETVTLPPLTLKEGVELLATLLGRTRIDAARSAAEEIVRRCEGLPLMLQAAAAQLSVLPLEGFAKALVASRNRLGLLSLPGLDLRSAYDMIYRRLDDETRTALLLVSQVRGSEVTVAEAAEAFGRDLCATESLLARLAEHHLLGVHREDERNVTFSVPELVRMYAHERLTAMLWSASDSLVSPSLTSAEAS